MSHGTIERTRGTLRWVEDAHEVRRLAEAVRRSGKRVGLVPTMGNLHDGHLSLIRRAKVETDFVVTTIFVNPLQFGPNEDFTSYPRTPERDRELCEAEGVDVIFAPPVETMYPPANCTRVQVTGLESRLCGASRPGHFVGVATVVAKMFNLVPADLVYFGQKDYQQARIIRQLIADLDFPLELRLCPIVREPDGLAMSSRNAYLSPQERAQATVLRQSLDLAESMVRAGERNTGAIRDRLVALIGSRLLARLDYAELVDAQTLQRVERIEGCVLAALAVRFGNARLIDNTLLVP